MRKNHQADIVNYTPEKRKEPIYEVLVNITEVISKGSDRPVHLCSPIRTFVARTNTKYRNYGVQSNLSKASGQGIIQNRLLKTGGCLIEVQLRWPYDCGLERILASS